MHKFFRILISISASKPASPETEAFSVYKGDSLIIFAKSDTQLQSCIVKMPSGKHVYSSKSLEDGHISEEIIR